jgi:uncharacterized membrane protein
MSATDRDGMGLLGSIRFLVLLLIAAIVSTLLHELGHCVLYWLQGIPAAMSLTKEYPLRDITAMQYSIGSVGGPLANVVQITAAIVLYRGYSSDRALRDPLSALILANVFYFILRALIAVLKRDGGELDSAAQLAGLDYRAVVALFVIITVVFLSLWMKASGTPLNLRNSLIFIGLLVFFVIVLGSLQSIDQKLFWNKFPTIQIDDGRVYNVHR